jgi:acetolactate decarboxylase
VRRHFSEALSGQVVFDLHSVEAVMVGFWLPAVLGNVNVAGFHFHALTKDETAGGHVLGCEAADVKVEIDRADELRIRFDAAHRPRHRSHPRPGQAP